MPCPLVSVYRLTGVPATWPNGSLVIEGGPEGVDVLLSAVVVFVVLLHAAKPATPAMAIN
jgi:hypothetical protein